MLLCGTIHTNYTFFVFVFLSVRTPGSRPQIRTKPSRVVKTEFFRLHMAAPFSQAKAMNALKLENLRSSWLHLESQQMSKLHKAKNSGAEINLHLLLCSEAIFQLYDLILQENVSVLLRRDVEIKIRFRNIQYFLFTLMLRSYSMYIVMCLIEQLLLVLQFFSTVRKIIL